MPLLMDRMSSSQHACFDFASFLLCASLIRMDSLQRIVGDGLLPRSVENALMKILSYSGVPGQRSLSLAAGVALFFLCLCRILRFRRINSLRKRFKYTRQSSLRGLTNTDAHAIIKTMSQLEFPLIFKQSLSFALFKVLLLRALPCPQCSQLTLRYRRTGFRLFPTC
jgi:hypothetical protein